MNIKINHLYKLLISGFIIFSTILLSACYSENSTSKGKKNIVVASYPEYDWLCHILGENQNQYNITLLMNKGVDLHSYQPSIQDMAKIVEADLFLYNGGISYQWVDKVEKQVNKSDRQSLNLMESLSHHTPLLEGSQCTHEHEHEHEHEHHHAEHDVDEHIWLSLRNAIILCNIIEEALSQLDPEYSHVYEANKKDYIAKLSELDTQFTDFVQSAPRNTLIIADRFPFLYLMRDYKLQYHAAFEGCSAETEASFETVAELTKLVTELSPPAIIILNGGMKKLAETILKNSDNTHCRILEVNAIHSATPTSTQDSESYANIMETNLKVFKEALSQ